MHTSLKTALALSILCLCATFAPAADLGQASAEKINKALDGPASIEFADTPLRDAAAYLADKYKIPVLIDHRALGDAGISDDSVMLSYRSHKLETLRGALQRMLGQEDLTAIIRDEVLQITTIDAAESILTLKVYPVKDIPAMSGKPFWFDESEFFVPDVNGPDHDLINLLQSSVACTTWDEVGGPGSMQQLGDQLIVSATDEVHRELQALLAALKKYAAFTPDNSVPETTFVFLGSAAPKPEITAALKEPTEVEFVDTSLPDIVSFLRDLHYVPVLLDRKGLEDSGIAVDDLTVTFSARGMSLATVLKHMLDSLNLTICLDGETILITPQDSGCARPLLGLHYVADLVQVKLPDGSVKLAPQELIDCIEATVQPTTWDSVGGFGSCGVCGSCLVVSQSREGHAEIESLLKELRTRQAGQPIKEVAAEKPYVAAYRLGRIEQAGQQKRVEISPEEAEKVARALEQTIRPEQWKSAGGENSIEVVMGAILVRAPRSVHRGIQSALEQLGLMTPQPVVGGGGFF